MQLNTSRIGQNLDIFKQLEHLNLPRRDVPGIGVVTSGAANLGTKVASLASPAVTKLHHATTTTSSGFGADATSLLHAGESQVSKATAEIASKVSSAESAAKSAADDVGSWIKSEGHHIGSELEGEIHNLTNWIETELADGVRDLARILGLQDFYSAHILDFCEGYFVPNTTAKNVTIHKHVTSCSNKTAGHHFDPTSTIAKQLNDSTDGLIDLTKLHWPSEISDGLNALKDAQKAVAIFYFIAIAMIFLALAVGIVGVFVTRRLTSITNVLVHGMAFMTIMIPSAVVTFIAKHATHFINKYGQEVGVSATKGNKFLTLTWATTALVLLASLIWYYEMVMAFWEHHKMKRVHHPKKGEAYSMTEM